MIIVTHIRGQSRSDTRSIPTFLMSLYIISNGIGWTSKILKHFQKLSIAISFLVFNYNKIMTLKTLVVVKTNNEFAARHFKTCVGTEQNMKIEPYHLYSVTTCYSGGNTFPGKR